MVIGLIIINHTWTFVVSRFPRLVSSKSFLHWMGILSQEKAGWLQERNVFLSSSANAWFWKDQHYYLKDLDFSFASFCSQNISNEKETQLCLIFLRTMLIQRKVLEARSFLQKLSYGGFSAFGSIYFEDKLYYLSLRWICLIS